MALDWYQIATLLVAILFGGQGVHSWLKQREAKTKGLPPTEDQAQRTYLTTYLQTELDALRGSQVRELDSTKRELARVRKLRELDAELIDALEAHIWEGKPPPPPRRKTNEERLRDK